MMNISICIKCNIKIETHLIISIFAACHMYTEYIQTRTVSLSQKQKQKQLHYYFLESKTVKITPIFISS